MPPVVLGPGGAPLPMETPFISSNDTAVLFLNFQVDHTELRPDHDAYIKNILVPHYINQIEALGFSDRTMTVKPVGKASATGSKDHNMTLSIGRAQSVGNAVKKYFDAQKSRGKFSQNVDIVIQPLGQGDKEERDLIGPPRGSPKRYEDQSNQFRAVALSLLVRHNVVDDDLKIFCRQILDAKLTPQTVPTNLLEQKIAEIQQKMPPELKAALNEFFDAVKGLVKTIVEQMLKAAEFLGPEVFIIFKGVEFIVPSDIALLFEFKDAKGRTKKYRFDGSANKIDVNAIEIFCQVLSIIKWLTKLPEGLEELESELEEEEKKLNVSHELIDKIKNAIDTAKKIAGKAKTIFDAVTAPNSLFRKILGNSIVDIIVKAVNAGSSAVLGDAQLATEFAPVSFESKGLFDIGSFRGAAEVETREHRGSPTTVALDFAARQNQPLLGWRAHTLMEREFQLSFSLGSFEISRGNLLPN